MKLLKIFLKIAGAGILAVLLLSVLLAVYSTKPIHLANDGGNTDYVWEPNARWMDMSEGIAWGKYDAQGFNNVTVAEDPDILLLGSSHMEAISVLQTRNTGYLLGKALEGKYTVYNMGISGHDLFKICHYLPQSLTLDDTPPKAVVMETSTLTLTSEQVAQVLEHRVPYTPSYSTGIVAKLQKLPFLRLLRHQMDSGLLNLLLGKTAPASGKEAQPEAAAYDALFAYLADLQTRYGSRIILFYHPSGTLSEDGELVYSHNAEAQRLFAAAAEQYDITFVDMTDAFQRMYREEHHVAHGFVNSPLDRGHLNEWGHAAIAEEVAAEILRLEQEGKLCR